MEGGRAVTDTRPSEDRFEPVEMRRRGFFDDVPTLDKDFFVEPEPQPTVDNKAEAEDILAHRASPNDPNGLALAHAVLHLAEQQRIANLIAVCGQLTVREQKYWDLMSEIEKGLGL
jgi:hypothetical protein